MPIRSQKNVTPINIVTTSWVAVLVTNFDVVHCKKNRYFHISNLVFYPRGTDVREGECIEVLHYLQNNDRLTRKVWLFPQTGTGVFYKVGRLKIFKEHYEMNKFFDAHKYVPCTLKNKCRYVSRASIQNATRSNYGTIQFMNHTQDVTVYSEK